jgi:iron complex transport system ATP-binding protein
MTALVGPNGSGKTTLLRLMAGLWSASEGKVVLDGKELREITHRQLSRHITFVPQDTHLAFAFTVRDAVAMGRHPHLGRFERESAKDRRAINEAMERADIAHLSDRRVTEISGGERQRVIIARSLATEADTILLDEPTASLDISHALEILDLSQELAQEGKMIAFAIHDLNAAASYATEVALLHDGRLAAYGKPLEVLTDSAVRTVFRVDSERLATQRGKSVFIFERAADKVKFDTG